MKIDLQLHTTFSDGRDTPNELVRKAKVDNVDTISVTEHDNIDSWQEIAQICENEGVHALPGVEISTTYLEKTIHILGYSFDPTLSVLPDFFQRSIEYRKQRLIEQFDILNANLRMNGKQEADPHLYAQRPNKYFTKPGLAQFLSEVGITSTKADGFAYFTGIIRTAPEVSPSDAINIVHSAGGKAVFSHPLAPKMSLKELQLNKNGYDDVVRQYVESGLDGIETYGTGHHLADVATCKAWVNKFN